MLRRGLELLSSRIGGICHENQVGRTGRVSRAAARTNLISRRITLARQGYKPRATAHQRAKPPPTTANSPGGTLRKIRNQPSRRATGLATHSADTPELARGTVLAAFQTYPRASQRRDPPCPQCIERDLTGYTSTATRPRSRLTLLESLIVEHEQELMEAWHDYFGS